MCVHTIVSQNSCLPIITALILSTKTMETEEL